MREGLCVYEAIVEGDRVNSRGDAAKQNFLCVCRAQCSIGLAIVALYTAAVAEG
jgi:hypothetical protein